MPRLEHTDGAAGVSPSLWWWILAQPPGFERSGIFERTDPSRGRQQPGIKSFS